MNCPVLQGQEDGQSALIKHNAKALAWYNGRDDSRLKIDLKLLPVGMVNVPCQGKVSIGTWNTGASAVYERGYATKAY